MNTPRRYFIVLCTVLLCAGLTSAQAPDVDWMKTYGGVSSELVYAIDVAPGGYIITGKTTSFGGGNADLYVLKTDSNGDSLWMTVWGTSRQEHGRDIVSCSGGGYAVVGIERLTQASQPQIVFHKLNAAGAIVTTKNYGHVGNDRSWSIVETSDGGFAMAGDTDVSNSGQTDVYLIRTDATGDTLWTRNYGGAEDDEGYRAEQTADGGFVVTGGSSSFADVGDWDVYLIRTDAGGDTLWTRTYGGPDYDIGHCVRQTSDGGFIIAGETRSYGAGNSDFYLIKTDAAGDTSWTRTYGGDRDDVARSVQCVNNGYTVAGYTESFGGFDNDAFVVRTNLLGDALWTKVIGGGGEDCGYSFVALPFGTYVIAGYTGSWGAGGDDAWMIKLDSDATGIENRAPEHRLQVRAHPNPFNPATTITYRLESACHATISVYDAAGRRLETLLDGVLPAGERGLTWNASGYPSGVYFVRLEARGETRVAKAVLLK
jgi:hypothetical protein